MIKLIKNAKVYSPEYLGNKDILIVNDKIAKIENKINIQIDDDCIEIIDATNKFVIPGLIDCHVHILGGGGEGGFRTRTPEIMLSDLIHGGVTTVVGCLGTDGVTRSMESLVAKAYGLREEGISAYVYTGSYKLPLKTVTGSIQKDIIMVEPIIGIGEVAISDHRSSSPTVEDLSKAAADARVGGILSGKAGLVNIHLGDGKQMLDYLFYMKAHTEIPMSQFLPTHTNRNPELFEEAIRYAKDGGYIDFTTSTVPVFIEEGEVRASDAYQIALSRGVSSSQMTFSSDGQGSLPLFDGDGILKGLNVGSVTSLYASVKELLNDHKVSLQEALKPVTINPAKLLKLGKKGQLAPGFDADFIMLDPETFNITDVYAMGQNFMKNSVITRKGTFEK